MQTKREQLNPTTVKLTIIADHAELADAKQEVLRRLSKQAKLPGFRPGKAPLAMVERSADSNLLQSDVLDTVMNRLYGAALDTEKLRPVQQPKVTLQKFVPFTLLEFVAEVTTIGVVTLPDYRKFKLAQKPVEVTEKKVDEVVRDLQRRAADKHEVERAAKDGDEAVIDFVGKDAKTSEAVRGADGKGYPLLLGSDTFIPGFEANLIGLKPGGQKTFTLTFPGDYGVAALKNRKITFDVIVTKVHELTEPKADDAFAAKAGPFKTIEALRADIHRQLVSEMQAQADRQYQNELVDKLAAGTTAAIPDVLVDEEVQQAEQEVRRNLSYRGQTWQEYLDELGQDEAAYRLTLRQSAEQRIKAGLALTEVAEREGIIVTPEEFKIRMQLLKGQYNDSAMKAELEKPENARTVMSGMLTEKTIAKLVQYAAGKDSTSIKA